MALVKESSIISPMVGTPSSSTVPIRASFLSNSLDLNSLMAFVSYLLATRR